MTSDGPQRAEGDQDTQRVAATIASRIGRGDRADRPHGSAGCGRRSARSGPRAGGRRHSRILALRRRVNARGFSPWRHQHDPADDLVPVLLEDAPRRGRRPRATVGDVERAGPCRPATWGRRLAASPDRRLGGDEPVGDRPPTDAADDELGIPLVRTHVPARARWRRLPPRSGRRAVPRGREAESGRARPGTRSGDAADARDLGDARDRGKLGPDVPVLDRAKTGRGRARRPRRCTRRSGRSPARRDRRGVTPGGMRPSAGGEPLDRLRRRPRDGRPNRRRSPERRMPTSLDERTTSRPGRPSTPG